LSEEGKKLIKDLDDELDQDELTDTQKAKAKWTQLEALIGSEQPHKEHRARHRGHFEARQEVFAGKGMIVSMSRRIAADLYDEIRKPCAGLAFDERSAQGRDQGGDDGRLSDGPRWPSTTPPRSSASAGRAHEGRCRCAEAGDRARHVAHRLRCAQHAHAVHRQADEGPQPDAGHCAREPRAHGTSPAAWWWITSASPPT
jgi:hypothetical protein